MNGQERKTLYESIRERLDDGDEQIRIEAIREYGRLDEIDAHFFPFDIIQKAMNDESYLVREVAMWACLGRLDPRILNLIRQGLRDTEYEVCRAAIWVYEEAPIGWLKMEIIELGLENEDREVKWAARKILERFQAREKEVELFITTYEASANGGVTHEYC